jgi:hypothetical protein
MMTSGSVGGFMVPLGGLLKREFAGEVYDVGKMVTKKRKAKRKFSGRVYEVVSFDGGIVIEAKSEKKYKVDGKTGVWRTIRGRHYFFPDDKSGPIPPIKGASHGG